MGIKAGQIIKPATLLTARQKSSLWDFSILQSYFISHNRKELSIYCDHMHIQAKVITHPRTCTGIAHANIRPHKPNLVILRSVGSPEAPQ